MKTVGFYNGKLDEIENIYVPMTDRGMYFGDGVYDACMVANRKMHNIDAHLDRFYNSAAGLKIEFEMDKEQLRAQLQECVDNLDSGDVAFVYWQITRGSAIREHIFPESGSANLLIFVTESHFTNLRKQYKLITVEDTRYLHCNIKTLNLLPNVMAAQKGKEHGCNEIVFHRGDRVTECAHSNIHIIKDGVFRTAPTDNMILPGTCRKKFIGYCEKLGIPVEEKPFTLEEMFNADEVIVSSCSTLGVQVGEIDGKKVGGKAPEILHKLHEMAVKHVEEDTGYKLDIL